MFCKCAMNIKWQHIIPEECSSCIYSDSHCFPIIPITFPPHSHLWLVASLEVWILPFKHHVSKWPWARRFCVGLRLMFDLWGGHLSALYVDHFLNFCATLFTLSIQHPPSVRNTIPGAANKWVLRSCLGNCQYVMFIQAVTHQSNNYALGYFTAVIGRTGGVCLALTLGVRLSSMKWHHRHNQSSAAALLLLLRNMMAKHYYVLYVGGESFRVIVSSMRLDCHTNWSVWVTNPVHVNQKTVLFSLLVCLVLLDRKGIELWGGLVHTFTHDLLNFVSIFVSYYL